MLIIDRYIIRLFLKIVLVSSGSLVGLYIVVDLVGKLDDLMQQGAARGSLLTILLEFYGARTLTFLDKVIAPLMLLATVGTIAWMRRRHELTAIQSTGTSPLRVIKPLIPVVIGISILSVLSREFLIPCYHDRLTRSAQNWDGSKYEPLRPHHDHQTDILIGGRWTRRTGQSIVEPVFRLHKPIGQFQRPIVAESAEWRAADDQHPSGYLLSGVSKPRDLDQRESAFIEREAVILSPRDTPWLSNDQCFVASSVDFDQLTLVSSSYRYQSSRQLIRVLASRQMNYSTSVRVTLHSRMVRPLLDLTLFFLGIPLVLSSRFRNIFLSSGICIGMLAIFYTVMLTCHAMGAHGFLLTPVVAAWLPLLVMAPIACGLFLPLISNGD